MRRTHQFPRPAAAGPECELSHILSLESAPDELLLIGVGRKAP